MSSFSLMRRPYFVARFFSDTTLNPPLIQRRSVSERIEDGIVPTLDLLVWHEPRRQLGPRKKGVIDSRLTWPSVISNANCALANCSTAAAVANKVSWYNHRSFASPIVTRRWRLKMDTISDYCSLEWSVWVSFWWRFGIEIRSKLDLQLKSLFIKYLKKFGINMLLIGHILIGYLLPHIISVINYWWNHSLLNRYKI